MSPQLVLLLLVLVVVVNSAAPPPELFSAKWLHYKAEFNKTYKSMEEEIQRFNIIKEKSYLIAEHNQRFFAGQETYELELNDLSDLTEDEISSSFYGYNGIEDLESLAERTLVSGAVNDFQSIPTSINWLKKGAVTKVKNQGRCGSCWAFSATGAIEGAVFLKTRKLVSLSEQNLLDCSKKNHGCRGGRPSTAMEYVISNDGIATDKAYPYKGEVRSCRFDRRRIGAKISAVGLVPKGNEGLLLQAVATKGPISVAINAMGSFRSYRKGVYSDPNCNPNALNHAVLVVGYGHDAKHGQYWLVKNSWGTRWGEKGYIRIVRGKNMCGIAQAAVYAIA